MALALQISEPGCRPSPTRAARGRHRPRYDELARRHGAQRRAGVLADSHGRPLLPSIVRYLPDGRVEVGYAAQARQADDPKNTIVSVKRYMGRGIKDVAHIESTPYDFVDAPGMLQIRTAAGVKSPVEVSSEILKVLRERAELSLQGTMLEQSSRSRLLRRRAAPGDQGRGAHRRPERAAIAERADRGGDRLRPGQRGRGNLRGLRPGRRHVRPLDPETVERRVRSRGDERRLDARRRRLRPAAVLLGGGAGKARAARAARHAAAAGEVARRRRSISPRMARRRSPRSSPRASSSTLPSTPRRSARSRRPSSTRRSARCARRCATRASRPTK